MFDWFFGDGDFRTRGLCGPGWTFTLIFLYKLFNALISFAYFCIPFIGAYYWRKRRQEITYPVTMLFVLCFIFFCGLSHVCDFVVFNWAPYRLFTLILGLTAFFSVGTCVLLPSVIAALIKIPSREMLFHANEVAQQSVLSQELAVKQLEKKNETLKGVVVRLESVVRTQMWVHDVKKTQDELESALKEIQDGIALEYSDLLSRPDC